MQNKKINERKKYKWREEDMNEKEVYQSVLSISG